MSKINLRESRLRANPAYELVLYDRLSEPEKHVLRSLAEDPACYGVLRPRADSTLSMKSVSQDTALLLFSLQAPGLLPRFAVEALRDECDQVIGKMILDGVLELEIDDAMVCGPAAFAVLSGAGVIANHVGTLAEMSRRAIDYAAALELADPIALAGRLYRYNTIPASRRWRELLPDDGATAEYLGLVGGAAGRTLAGEWRSLPESEGWISWQSRGGRAARPYDGNAESTYKLYVSPTCERLREAVEGVAAAIARSNAVQWKVGKGIHGLLRPDKIVVYFRQFADLQETALKIVANLQGCSSHGVPFTSELAGAGLLSWGVDPPMDARGELWSRAESWRVKVCNRLALALTQALAQRGQHQSVSPAQLVSPTQFALERLRLEGVDTNTWTAARVLSWSN